MIYKPTPPGQPGLTKNKELIMENSKIICSVCGNRLGRHSTENNCPYGTGFIKDSFFVSSGKVEKITDFDVAVSMGFDPKKRASTNYVQKTDDCDWIF
jgi:hypothetical protein